MSVERCEICGGAKSGYGTGGCACEIPQNLCSTQHEHEPQIPPTYDDEGRCLICVMLVKIRDLKTIAFHLGEDKKELQFKLSAALDAGKEGWNQFYALRKQIADEKHPGMIQEVKANGIPRPK